MSQGFSIALKLVWSALLLYWLYGALGTKPVARQQGRWRRIALYWLPLTVAVLLLGPGDWFGHGWLREAFLPHSTAVESFGLALCIGGALLACWSRHLLGRNWSVSVQIKQEHELIQDGPYRWLRHPIYSGLLLMFIGTCIMVGDIRGILAVVIVLLSFWFKLRQEERWLLERFGQPYRDYMARTKALIPALL